MAGCARLRSGLQGRRLAKGEGKVESQQQTDSPLKHLPFTPDQLPRSKLHQCPPDSDAGHPGFAQGEKLTPYPYGNPLAEGRKELSGTRCMKSPDETVKTAENKISAEIPPSAVPPTIAAHSGHCLPTFAAGWDQQAAEESDTPGPGFDL